MESNSPMSYADHLDHPCHPGHLFSRHGRPPPNQLCSICRAASTNSPVAWYACRDPHCGFLMCHKCFEVRETLFTTPQLMIRNPVLAHNDDQARVHTRPRASSHVLAPLYAGKLIKVVSKAESAEDPGHTFLRMNSGGWISSASVVSIVPSDPSLERLAEYHLELSAYEAAALGGSPRALAGRSVPLVTPAELTCFTKESIQMTEGNAQYGIVLSSLTLTPLLNMVAVRRGKEPFTDEEKEMADSVVCFLHYVMLTVLEELESSLEDELPIENGTMLPLNQIILVRCVLAAEDIQTCWHVGLPDSFAGLLLRTIAVLGRVQLLLAANATGAEVEPIHLRTASVITVHVDLGTERARLHSVAREFIEVAARLLVSLSGSGPVMDIKSLQPLREVLTYGHNEILEKAFCDLAAMCINGSLLNQRRFLHPDPLEVAVRLCRPPQLAESQTSVFRLIAAAARRNPRNIAVVTPVLLEHLLFMAKSPRSPAVLASAVDCFFELAYNNPRGESLDGLGDGHHQDHTPLRCPSTVADAAARGLPLGCTQVLHPGCAPFQLGQTFALENGSLVNLCSACAAHHPPASSVEASETAYMVFCCQCTCCRNTPFSQPLPPPSVPETSAIMAMHAKDISAFLVGIVDKYRAVPELLNAVGRLALRLEVREHVIAALFEALAAQPDLRRFAEAVLAVGSYSHLPCIAGLLRQQDAAAPLCQYIASAYHGARAGKAGRGLASTAGRSSAMRSEFGLSPSPDVSSVYQSSHRDFRGGSAAHFSESYPAVDLFSAASRLGESSSPAHGGHHGFR